MQPPALRTGDFLSARVKAFPLVIHRGVVVVEGGNTWIYHLTPTKVNAAGGNVVRDSLGKWLETRCLTGVEHSSLTEEQIVKAVQNTMAKRFDLIGYNCEHWIYQLKDGRPRSPQLIQWGVIATACILLRIFS